MRRYTSLALMVFVMAWGGCLVAANSGEDLWNRAVAVAKSNRNWVPGRLVSHIKMLTRKGRVKDHIETWLKLEEGLNSRIVASLEKYIKNGIDETEMRKKRFLEARKKREAENQKDPGDRASRGGYAIGLQDHPFAAESQESVSFELLQTDVFVAGKACSLYSYRQKLEGDKVVWRTGKVWIDQESGIPLENRFTLEPLPSMVKRFTQHIVCDAGSPRAWYPESLEIDGVGGFLFIKKYFWSRVVFSQYFKRRGDGA